MPMYVTISNGRARTTSRNQAGGSLVEYSLLLALICLMAIPPLKLYKVAIRYPLCMVKLALVNNVDPQNAIEAGYFNRVSGACTRTPNMFMSPFSYWE